MIVKLALGEEQVVDNKVIRFLSMENGAVKVSIQELRNSSLIKKLENNISNVIRFKRKN